MPINIMGEQFPDWATEDTLRKLVSATDQNQVLQDTLFKTMNNLDSDIGELSSKFDDYSKADAEKELIDDSLSRATSRVAKGAVDLASKFDDTKKPLSSMVDMVGNLKEGASNLGKGSGALATSAKKATAGLTGMMGNFLPGLDLATDGMLAYAGFVAAKAEQFAEAQGKMIDSGAIFFASAQSFEELKDLSYKAGVTYNQFAETVNGYGRAMTALGDGVSGGASRFLDLFTNLNIANDQFGDFGLSNQEMMSSFAEFIEAQRASGDLDRLIAGSGMGLLMEYQKLQKESSALATATMFTNKQIVGAKIEALQDVDFASVASMLDETRPDVADAARTIAGDLKLLSLDNALGAELGGKLSSVFTDGMEEFRKTGEFTLTAAGDQGVEIKMLFQTLGLDIEKQFNQMLQSGNTASGDFVRLMSTFDLRSQDQLSFGAAEAKQLGHVRNRLFNFQKAMESFGNLSNDELKVRLDGIGNQLKGAGNLTVTMNNLAQAMLRIQNALVPNMVTFSEILDTITGVVANNDPKEGFAVYNDFEADVLLERIAAGDTTVDPEEMEALADYAIRKERELRREAAWQNLDWYNPLDWSNQVSLILDDTIYKTFSSRLEDLTGTLYKDNGDWFGRTQTEIVDIVSRLKDVEERLSEGDKSDFVFGHHLKREKGGPVKQDMPYIVGEKGPEVVVPGSDGTVLNAYQTSALMNVSKPTKPPLYQDQLKQQLFEMLSGVGLADMFSSQGVPLKMTGEYTDEEIKKRDEILDNYNEIQRLLTTTIGGAQKSSLDSKQLTRNGVLVEDDTKDSFISGSYNKMAFNFADLGLNTTESMDILTKAGHGGLNMASMLWNEEGSYTQPREDEDTGEMHFDTIPYMSQLFAQMSANRDTFVSWQNSFDSNDSGNSKEGFGYDKYVNTWKMFSEQLSSLGTSEPEKFKSNIAGSLGIEFRESGGPVASGSQYVVGEAGPEMVIPDGFFDGIQSMYEEQIDTALPSQGLMPITELADASDPFTKSNKDLYEEELKNARQMKENQLQLVKELETMIKRWSTNERTKRYSAMDN